MSLYSLFAEVFSFNILRQFPFFWFEHIYRTILKFLSSTSNFWPPSGTIFLDCILFFHVSYNFLLKTRHLKYNVTTLNIEFSHPLPRGYFWFVIAVCLV